MPQHPVYMKLGINKYYRKNQHRGLNALIHVVCIFESFPVSFFLSSDDFSPSIVCTSHGHNLKGVTLILFYLTAVCQN